MRPIYLFLFQVDFFPLANPPGTADRFVEALKGYLKERHLRCLIGGQGGTACAYGVVYRKRWGVKEEHRLALADWIKEQPICATARLSDLEEDNDSTDLSRKVTGRVFEVDNLNATGR
jgi:hypothetical protein